VQCPGVVFFVVRSVPILILDLIWLQELELRVFVRSQILLGIHLHTVNNKTKKIIEYKRYI